MNENFLKNFVMNAKIDPKVVMESESSEYVRKTTGFFTNSWRIKTALESYFEEHSLREKLDESRDADYVVEHISSKIDGDDSESNSRTTQRTSSTAYS